MDMQYFLFENTSSLLLLLLLLLLYQFKDPEKPRVLLLGPTGISAVIKVEPPFILVLNLNLEQSYLV